jgi:cation diffusion facilitator family transporter
MRHVDAGALRRRGAGAVRRHTPPMPSSPQLSAARLAWLSVAAALATIALKSAAWWVSGSVGLLSDAAESLVNLAAALLAVSMLRVAASPPGEEYPYGRSKAEYLAAGFEGALILAAAGGIALAAAVRLLEPRPLEAPGLGLALCVAASGINWAVAGLLRAGGRRLHSVALEADAQHLLTDVWSSAAVIAGVAGVWASGWLRLDPLIALAVAAFIAFTGLRLLRRAISGLLDGAIAPEEQHQVQQLLEQFAHQLGVAFHALRTRQAGSRRFISFHLLVPDAWTVLRAHELSEELEARIRALVPHATVFTHIEPIADASSYADQELDR